MVVYYVSFTAMGIHLCMFIYYIYVAYNIPQSLSDRQLYYTTAIVPLAPFTMYGLNIANYIINDYAIDSAFLNMFFIEWCITIPLLLTNISRVINIQNTEQLLFALIGLTMMILGYISHISKLYIVKLILYGVASTMFVGSCSYLIIRYINQKRYATSVNKVEYNYLVIYKTIISTLLVTWIIYPIIFIVYTLEYITHEECAVSYICMDIFTKSVFTMLLLGYQENKNRRHSVLTYIARKATRIKPIETTDTTTNRFELEYNIDTVTNDSSSGSIIF